MDFPLVSCLMVTRDRARLARRAIRCFAEQSWPNRELLILDDGTEDYAGILEPYAGTLQIRYHRLEPKGGLRLGDLRNIALERAAGDFVAQWDDDEWYHPARIETQMGAVARGLDAVVLRDTLCHIDAPGYAGHPFHSRNKRSVTPGTVLHRRTALRYPSLGRAEDTHYLTRLRSELSVGELRAPHSHLFIRCFHGENTWELSHFEDALRHSFFDRVAFQATKYVFRNVLLHPAFRLTDVERDAARRFLGQSRELGLLVS
jgi:glycosyltransferase involved in cell wall biosynthesis